MPPEFALHAQREWPLPASDGVLRLGCWNIQVDHDRDQGTDREWRHRRPLAAEAVRALGCDLLLIQEPGPPAAADLQAELPDYRVEVCPCDPGRWCDQETPKQGQAFDGNGFAWRPERLELLEPLAPFWFSSDRPEASGGDKWDGSEFERTGVVGRFRDRLTGWIWHCASVHLDHAGELARQQSARMAVARAAAGAGPKTVLVLGGDFNTFPSAGGPETYDALAAAAAEAGLVDVRAANGVEVCDFGVGGHSWKGWPGMRFCREQNLAEHGHGQDASRFDQVFVSSGAKVRSTGVVEQPEWAAASDHVPIIVEFISEQ